MGNGRGQESRAVRNRDIPLLSRVRYVMQDIRSLERRRAFQRDRIYHITQSLTGMPGGGGQSHGIDDAIASMDRIDEEHREKLMEYTRELKAAERILSGIPSRTMRTFVRMLYMEGMAGDRVREELGLSQWSFRRARESIEQAECMSSVVWREKYILEENPGRK